jgi:hypothetical protein
VFLTRAVSILDALVLNAPHDLHASIVTMTGGREEADEEAEAGAGTAEAAVADVAAAAAAFLRGASSVLGDLSTAFFFAGGFLSLSAGAFLLALGLSGGPPPPVDAGALLRAPRVVTMVDFATASSTT